MIFLIIFVVFKSSSTSFNIIFICSGVYLSSFTLQFHNILLTAVTISRVQDIFPKLTWLNGRVALEARSRPIARKSERCALASCPRYLLRRRDADKCRISQSNFLMLSKSQMRALLPQPKYR
jgi:hypothetical protein